MTDLAVDLINITKRFGRDIVAVDDLTLRIEQGEYISFIGPSGCGKTTTLRLVSGFEEPTAGQVLIAGKDCTHLEPHERNTAMVFQHFALFPHMTVSQNVEFGLRMRKVPAAERQQRALQMLRDVDIEELADRPIAQLSGGQQQRVGLARALVTRPDILLLDEPLGSLDANLRLRMQRELRRLNTELGVAFMHVTHTQAEAFAVSDRVVIMNKGRIEQVGSPEAVTKAPKNLFVAQFVGKNNIFAGEITGTDNGMATVSGPAGTFRARLHDGAEPGTKECSVVVRASLTRLLRDGEQEENEVEGQIGFSIFETSQIEFNIDLPSGHDLRVDEYEPPAEIVGLKTGDTVRVGWRADDALVVFE
jgi:spermidine/putrescine transport system ATP-binding protein